MSATGQKQPFTKGCFRPIADARKGRCSARSGDSKASTNLGIFIADGLETELVMGAQPVMLSASLG
ncbi:hypothetical protein DBR18_27980 [Pseudomonas sp. HMWF021]|nr:hypothetical protein DBR18_27980 [Pseudomonas sp. HMWF021]